MILKRVFVCACICILLNLAVSAQVYFNKQQSGTVGSAPTLSDLNLGATVDQVDYQTGTVNVNIPIYEIKTRGLSIPVSISYACRSFRVGEEEGPLGLGWNLNTGGQVVRQVNGLPDETLSKGMENISFPTAPFSFSNPDWMLFTYNVINGDMDGSWDVYSYSLKGGSGQFVKGGMTFPFDPATFVSINMATTHSSPLINTSDGYSYDFVPDIRKKVLKRKYYLETSSSAIWNNIAQYDEGVEHTTAWKINSIKSEQFPNDIINYRYTTISENVVRENTSEILPFSRNASFDANGNIISSAGYKVEQPVIAKTQTIQVSHQRLNVIEFPEGRLLFLYAGGSNDNLQEIQIQRKVYNVSAPISYETVKRFQFEYRVPDGSSYRELSKVKEVTINDKQIYAWYFEYNEDRLLPSPATESKQQDWWGYFNGAAANRTLLSTIENPFLLSNANNLQSANIAFARREAFEAYGESWTTGATRTIPMANRRADLACSKAQVLSKVTTPTSTMVMFNYELNKYSQIRRGSGSTTVIDSGAGIRINAIKAYGSNGNYVSEREFKYGWGDPEDTQTLNNVESGIGFMTVPGNVMASKRNFIGSGGNVLASLQDIKLLSHPVNNIVKWNGSCITYQAVTEIFRGDGYEKTYGGKNVYCYFPATNTLEWNGTSNSPMSDLYVPAFYINTGIKDYLLSNTPVTIYNYESFKNNPFYNLVSKVENRFKTINNPDTAPVSFFAAVQSMLAGVQNIVNNVCTFPPGANSLLTCQNYYSIPNMDDNGVSNYLPDKNGANRLNQYFTDKYGYAFRPINQIGLGSYRKVVDAVTVTNFDPGGFDIGIQKKLIRYENIAHLQPTWIGDIDAKGDTLIQRLRYSQDYPRLNGRLIGNGVRNTPIEVLQTIRRAGGNELIKRGELITYKKSGGTNIWNVDKVYTLKLNPVLSPVSGYQYHDGNTIIDSRYEVRQQNEAYDSYGNLTQYTLDGRRTALLWGYSDQRIIAAATNSSGGEIAYTDFETPMRSDEGSWSYSPVSTTTGTVPAGKVINLSDLGASGIQKVNGTLDPSKEYVISYYSTSTEPYRVTGTFKVDRTPTGGGWTYYRHVIKGNANIRVQSRTGDTNSLIGELRLYPATGSMLTASYIPVIGVRGTGDAAGRIRHYEFDASGRLEKERDEYINILNLYKIVFTSLNL